MQQFMDTWRRLHPHWVFRVWDDSDLAFLPRADLLYTHATCPAQLSDIARVDILRLYGGVYVDVDFEALEVIDDLLELGTFIVGAEDPPERNDPPFICNAFMAAMAGEPCLDRYARLQEEKLLTTSGSPNETTGPMVLTEVVRECADVTVLPREVLYPYGWWEPEARGRRFPETKAVHHWDGSWT